ncbi:MAG: TraR/DksA C4-type zinc finger protein [Burkholderiales bacterium]
MDLTRKQLDELQHSIQERHESLMAEIREEVARSRDETHADVVGPVTDAGDESIADLVADLDNAEVSRDLQEVRELEAAQARIAAGTYGTCAACGAGIDFERLRATPAAIRCVDCQRVHDKTYAHASEPKL